jgi:prolyl 4-hydroxylase
MNASPDLATLKRDAARGIPGASYNLGVWYLQAEGADRDPEAARTAFETAADAGFAPAMSALGYLYLRAQGVDYDAARAAEWFLQAAARGLPEARYRLGEMRAAGYGLDRDPETARQDFEAAAREGHPNAVTQLAYCLEHGLGGDPDTAGATDWYSRAAVAGDPRAQIAIGERYATGHTLPRDPVRALAWITRAEAAGHPGADPGTYARSAGLDEAQHRAARALAAEPRPVIDAPRADPPRPAGAEAEILAWSPRVFLYRGLVSAEERAHLIGLARPFLRPAMVLDRRTGERSIDEARRAHTARLMDPLRDLVVWNLERRLAALALLPPSNAEPFTIIRYGPGDEYRPHADYYDPADPGSRTGLDQGGQRVATFLLYLNRPAGGGATSFPGAGVSVPAEPGAGLLFFNCRPDGAPDPSTLHAGEPVTAGEKWLASRWIRAGRFRPR